MKHIYLALLYARVTETHLHSTQLISTRNRTQASHTQVRLASPRPIAHCDLRSHSCHPRGRGEFRNFWWEGKLKYFRVDFY